MTQEMKLKEVREQYEPGEVNLIRWMTPRSHNHIHSPNTESQVRKARINGDNLQAMSREEVMWDVDLDERIEWLTGSRGSTKLLAKNTLCEVEEL